MTDLSRLSDGERQILLLLSQGHTAKTAARALGTTEAGVNERLREARRKTGVGSSRELARMLRATGLQENRDEQFGMASPPVPTEIMERNDGQPRRRPILIGALLMVAFVFTAGAFAVLTLAQNTQAPHVVATYPAEGARVAAGEIILAVTFDRPMRPGGYSFIRRDPQTFPDCHGQPQISDDHRTFRVTCTLQAGRRYEIGFNDDRYRNFVSEEDGASAAPALVHFSAR